ncbi:MAG: hypothetical protein D6763_06055 [Alphaproteobacteria bacterium]|nr:MAG: hypothetical protein D6763_06055 [Alphaproteobacteria bacterium]
MKGLGLTAAIIALAISVLPAYGQNERAKGLFGSSETRSERIAAFVKWTDMTSRHQWEEARKGVRQPCRITAAFKCRRDEWQELIATLDGASTTEKLSAVNAFMNEAPYITDLRNWGVPDYWASVREFLRKDGDCEDYAIAKYYSLKALGFDPGAMRVVVVEDLNLKTAHAVLAVYINGEALILDNQMQDVVRASSIVHYRPIYSINEQAWWLHRS